jgi:hypothetical protein
MLLLWPLDLGPQAPSRNTLSIVLPGAMVPNGNGKPWWAVERRNISGGVIGLLADPRLRVGMITQTAAFAFLQAHKAATVVLHWGLVCEIARKITCRPAGSQCCSNSKALVALGMFFGGLSEVIRARTTEASKLAAVIAAETRPGRSTFSEQDALARASIYECEGGRWCCFLEMLAFSCTGCHGHRASQQ